MWRHFRSWLSCLPFSREVTTGERGERIAAGFLRKQGYRVVARNWRNPRDRRDELDLVCRDGEVLVFVEVKTRDSGALVAGYHAVDVRKKNVILRTAKVYLRKVRPLPSTYRFDIVEVTLVPAGGPEVRHYQNIDLFPKHFRP
jgi:putative endonuclease